MHEATALHDTTKDSLPRDIFPGDAARNPVQTANSSPHADNQTVCAFNLLSFALTHISPV